MVAFLDDIGKALSFLRKPAGAVAGGYTGLAKLALGKELDPENRLGYSNPLSGIAKGWNTGRSATDALDALYGRYDPSEHFLTQLVGGVGDVAADPLNVAIPGASNALKGVPLAGKVIEGAGTFGKVEKGAGLLPRVGQAGRYLQTGLSLGSPVEALSSVPLQYGAERGLQGLARTDAVSGLIGKFGSKAAGKAAEAAVEGTGDVAKKGLKQKIFGEPIPDVVVEPTRGGVVPDADLPVEAKVGEALGKAVREEAEQTAAGVDKLKSLLKEKAPAGPPKEAVTIGKLAKAKATPKVVKTPFEDLMEAAPSLDPDEALARVMKGRLTDDDLIKVQQQAADLKAARGITSEPKIGEALKEPVRGPLIGEPEPDAEALATLKQTVAKAKATKSLAKGTKAKAPKVGTIKVPAKKPLVPEPELPSVAPVAPLPPQATQLQMDLPISGPAATSVVPQAAPSTLTLMPKVNPEVPSWLKTAPKPFEEILGTQPQLGRAANPNVANLQSNPAIMQVLNDPALTEDKKLEMILRGLGAIA